MIAIALAAQAQCAFLRPSKGQLIAMARMCGTPDLLEIVVALGEWFADSD